MKIKIDGGVDWFEIVFPSIIGPELYIDACINLIS